MNRRKKEVRLHPTAQIHPEAKLAKDVEVGAYSVIGPGVSISSGTRIHDHVTIIGNVALGRDNEIFPYAVLGGAPQDIRFKRGDTTVKIGDGNVIREFVTIHRGTTKGTGRTVIGNSNYLMAYSHVAHDCELKNNVILSNGVQLGGHVMVENCANLGGLAAVHHFVTIGRLSFVGGLTRIVRDVPPFMTVEGNPAKVRCVNVVGCRRAGLAKDAISALKEAYKLLFRSDMPFQDAVKELMWSYRELKEIKYLLRFLKKTASGRQGRAREALRREYA
jgi:UDP-N-acetylglucosamine acyltransferase